MNIDKVHLVTFSPTRTSMRIGESIVRGINPSEVCITDLTLQPADNMNIGNDSLLIVTVPVYGGKIAPLALERMEKLQATTGTPTVAVVVYGNRAYEKALNELDAFLAAKGCKIIAGGTFIGEHSYSTSQHPIASGRPDEEDLQYAETFGIKIRSKIENATAPEQLYAVDVARIVRPQQPLFPLFRFIWKVIKLRKSGIPMPRIPETDTTRCTHCGYCVRHCPTGAILIGDECNTNAERCIRCCACVKGCTQKARTFHTPFAALLSDCFKRQKGNRIIL